MTQPSSSHRFLRRMAFAQAPGRPAPADPLAWALAQVDAPAPIALLAAAGPRADLPPEARLLSKMPEVMTAYRESWNAADAFFALDPALSQPQRQQKFRELLWIWQNVSDSRESTLGQLPSMRVMLAPSVQGIGARVDVGIDADAAGLVAAGDRAIDQGVVVEVVVHGDAAGGVVRLGDAHARRAGAGDTLASGAGAVASLSLSQSLLLLSELAQLGG